MNEDLAVEILKMVRSIDHKLDESITRLNTHVKEEDESWMEIKNSLGSLTLAFPDGDTQGHSAYHKRIIKIMDDREKFWAKMREVISGGVILGVLAWIGHALWTAFLQGPKS